MNLAAAHSGLIGQFDHGCKDRVSVEFEQVDFLTGEDVRLDGFDFAVIELAFWNTACQQISTSNDKIISKKHLTEPYEVLSFPRV